MLNYQRVLKFGLSPMNMRKIRSEMLDIPNFSKVVLSKMFVVKYPLASFSYVRPTIHGGMYHWKGNFPMPR